MSSMSDNQVNIHIGTVEDMGARFVEAWKSAEGGEAITRDHVTFLSVEASLSAISPKRRDGGQQVAPLSPRD